MIEAFASKISTLPKLIVIYGPTGSGKTDMSIEIAKKLDTEIISTDSRQIFRGMNIATGKITPEEMQGVPHHMLDVIDPNQEFSAWDFKKQALETMNWLYDRGKIPMLVWGTGLYIDSIIYDLDFESAPPSDPDLRDELAQFSNEELYEKLQNLDPSYALELHPNNRHYVERAIEVITLTWKSKKDFRQKKELSYDVLFLSPDYSDREKLYDRINRRVKIMFDLWAHDEFLSLREKWFTDADFGMNSIWYMEQFALEKGEITIEECIEEIAKNSRRYAKRQITWFQKYKQYI